ncbi:MAG TPA: pyridoxal phosphate-dependent aminotransferase [Candidatus Acidoferrales bacterium]|nr:pyridoxal phosphate-dependent aminotransferase [Candidatus Acidoferrales bacterium]
MQFTERVNRIAVSPTSAVVAEAEKYKARGVDLVDFGPGEPDFPTPEHIKQAAIRAIEQNFTKYTPTGGILALREAICAWHKRELGSSYEPKECIVSVGGKHAIFNAICALVQSGDEVLIPAPYWVSYPDIVKFAGGTPVYVETRADNNFCVSAQAIEAAMTPRTKLLIMDSPCNPTGAVVPEDEYARIYELCRQRGVWLMGDECYSHFVYPPGRPFSVASLNGSKPHVIIVGSMSKTFAMTGWRIGYALAPQPLIEAMVKLQSQSTSNPNSVAQQAALEAMRGPMDSVPAMLAEYTRRRARIVEGLRAIPGVTCTEPGGAFYAFPNVARHLANGSSSSRLPKSTTELSQQLLERAHVAVVPGEAFGAPGYLRISYATSMERIEEGLRRLGRFFSGAGEAREQRAELAS